MALRIRSRLTRIPDNDDSTNRGTQSVGSHGGGVQSLAKPQFLHLFSIGELFWHLWEATIRASQLIAS